MSTKASRVGTILADFASRASTSSRESGTATSPILASMVLNGYFAACAATVAVKALKSVDLPTLGSPTMPHLKPIARSSFSLCGGTSLDCAEDIVRRGGKRVQYRQPANTGLMLQVLRKEKAAVGTQGGRNQNAVEISIAGLIFDVPGALDHFEVERCPAPPRQPPD